MTSRRHSATALLVMAAVLVLASGCRLVGSGTLGYVPNPDERAATSGSVATIHAYRADPDDAWPPPGTLALWVRAENIPPASVGFGIGNSPPPALMYLVRLFGAVEPVRPDMGEYRTCEEMVAAGGRIVSPSHVIASLHVGDDRVISEAVLVDDTPENRDASWVITAATARAFVYLSPLRCGALTVVP